METPCTNVTMVVAKLIFSPSNVTRNYTSKYGLELLTRSIQEDVCILRRRDEGWVLIAGSVCFPSHWSLCKKMGKTLDEIHSPVPQINEAISGIITKKMDEMENDKPVERFNWTYSTSGYLTRAGSRIPQRTISEEKVPETFIRVERQTLRKIDNGDIIFTIRTYFHLIEQICRDKDLCSGLLSAILTTPKDVLEYRGMTPHRDVLVKYLEEWDKKTWYRVLMFTRLILPLKFHFNQEDYNYFKYNGKIARLNETSFRVAAGSNMFLRNLQRNLIELMSWWIIWLQIFLKDRKFLDSGSGWNQGRSSIYEMEEETGISILFV